MIDINKEECCGCSACSQICPQNCIDMNQDCEGFFYPTVDKDKCIDCHLCEKVCPSISKTSFESEQKAIVAYNTSEDRLVSSSGGIFSLLAKKIITDGGIVYGAVYDNNWLVKHAKCERVEELDKLRGSKYLQSSNEGVFSELKEYLLAGKKVLYVGTACQVTGLKTFLRKEYSNLFTVDVLCHGVPSPGVWERYIKYLQNKYQSKISEISFRDKVTGWKNYSFTVKFESGYTYTEKFNKNPFMRLFLGNTILRPACHLCKYKSLNRSSDLTIGDAWGVENIYPEMDDNKGASVVVIHNSKGRTMIESISNQIIKKECDVDKILPKSSDSRHPVKAGKGRKLAFLYYQKNKNIDQMCISVERNLKAKILKSIIH